MVCHCTGTLWLPYGSSSALRGIKRIDWRAPRSVTLILRVSSRLYPHTGSEAFHAYPQALKLSVASWMDAFVRLERLAADGPYSGQRLMRRSGISLLSMETAPPIHATASTRHDGCGFNITAQLERVMCRFYQADYACLPYELPRACRTSPSSEPELTSEISLGERAVSVAGASAKGASAKDASREGGKRVKGGQESIGECRVGAQRR